MSDLDYWLQDASENNWTMPPAPWWKRLPVIRHIRAAYLQGQVAQHNVMWRSVGKIPSGYDSWVIYGIWIGMESRP